MKLSNHIFWDVDRSKLDWEKRKRFVIYRVVHYGTLEDWYTIEKFYGKKTIGEEMTQERQLDKRVLSFLSCILEIPKEKFRCYTEKQLPATPFNS